MIYPLLLKGRRLPQVAAGATDTTTGVFDAGRGNVRKIDLLVLTNSILNLASGTVTLGGQNVLDGVSLAPFLWSAWSGHRVVPVGNFGQNQTYQVTIENGSTVAVDSWFLEYYENQYAADVALFKRRLNDQSLQTKQLSYGVSAVAPAIVTGSFVLPKNRGKIYAVQGFTAAAFGANPANENAAMSMTINGVDVFENVPTVGFRPDSSRQVLFPIDVEPGSTVKITVDASLAGVGRTIYAGATFFFIPDNC